MFYLLSLSGRWDPGFFNNLKVKEAPQQEGEQGPEQKRKTRAAVEARAKVRHAAKYECLSRKQALLPYQAQLVADLRNGTLQREANRLTKLSGHGRLRRPDGSFVDIGGSTGGFTRAALYDWTPPNLDEDWA